MDSVKKRLILPVIIFPGIMFININSIINGISSGQTWQVAVASASSAIMLAAIVFILIRLNKNKNRESSPNK